MRKTMWVGMGVLVGVLTLSFAARAAEEVRVDAKQVAAVQGGDERSPGPAHADRKKGRPQWLKVSVTQDNEKDKSVSVNVPLALLSLLGKDATVDLASLGVHGIKGNVKEVRIADLMDALEPGTVLVEVRETDSRVRVWVE